MINYSLHVRLLSLSNLQAHFSRWLLKHGGGKKRNYSFCNKFFQLDSIINVSIIEIFHILVFMPSKSSAADLFYMVKVYSLVLCMKSKQQWFKSQSTFIICKLLGTYIYTNIISLFVHMFEVLHNILDQIQNFCTYIYLDVTAVLYVAFDIAPPRDIFYMPF